MPLSRTLLRDGIVRALSSGGSAGVSARTLSQAYETYAITAACIYGSFVPTGSERPRLESMLQGALNPYGALQAFAAAWGAGLQLFWAGAVFGTGVAVPFVGVPIVIGGLTSVLSNTRNTLHNCAEGVATALDAGTRLLTIAGGGGPVPVT